MESRYALGDESHPVRSRRNHVDAIGGAGMLRERGFEILPYRFSLHFPTGASLAARDRAAFTYIRWYVQKH